MIHRPVALTIAGSDSSAGAGLQADLKAFTSAGVYGLSVATAIVAERPGMVISSHVLPPSSIRDQLDSLLGAYPIGAIKTGLLPEAATIEAIQERLRGTRAPLVIDPVAVASAGVSLANPAARSPLIALIRERGFLVTPNRAEAESFLGIAIEEGEAARSAVRALRDFFGCAVLLKGGHFGGEESIDWLADGSEEIIEFRRPRLPGGGVHGTGCAYSAAITARLATGAPLIDAVDGARSYLHAAMAQTWEWPASEGGTIKALAPRPES